MKNCSAQDKVFLLRRLFRTDLYFLLWFGCNRKDCEQQWVIDRCREIEASPNGHLDLWAREHYKSSIITFALTIQNILQTHGEGAEGDEVTVGIFSHNRPIAKGFLRQIKLELERNELLQAVFNDIFYDEPKRDAEKWSEDDGLIVKRKGNPKEATLEAWGLVDGMPTSKHFSVLNYDDLVTEKSVTSPEMIRKTTNALELSYNLGKRGGVKRFVGTRYAYSDSYSVLLSRGTVKPRIYAATVDGTVEGKPVMMTREELDEKRRDQGPYTFGCQMLQNPKSEETQGFKLEWLREFDDDPYDNTGNRYIVVDPANEKKKNSDWTAMWVVELRTDHNYYCLRLIKDKMSLTERTEKLFALHREYQPIGVGYEKYGMQSDIEHIEDVQNRTHYNFAITPMGGAVGQTDRIRKLIPLFEKGRIWFRKSMVYTNYEGRVVDLMQQFKTDEYEPFPVGHFDALDALSRILDEDLGANFPRIRTHNMVNTAPDLGLRRNPQSRRNENIYAKQR